MENMRWWEIRRAVKGIGRRGRVAYDANRLLGWIVLCALGGKAESPRDLLKFAWEREGAVLAGEDEEALERLRKEVEEYNRRAEGDKEKGK